MPENQNPVFTDATLRGDGTSPDPLGASGVAPSGFASIQKATFSLTSAQIKALKATPVQLVAAPGAGLQIYPEVLNLRLTFGGAAYTIPAGALLQMQTAAQIAAALNDALGFVDPTAFLNAVADSEINIPGFQTINLTSLNSGIPKASWQNSALMLTKDTATAEFTVGTGTIQGILYYLIG